jgi:hypothetical protein
MAENADWRTARGVTLVDVAKRAHASWALVSIGLGHRRIAHIDGCSTLIADGRREGQYPTLCLDIVFRPF